MKIKLIEVKVYTHKVMSKQFLSKYTKGYVSCTALYFECTKIISVSSGTFLIIMETRHFKIEKQ